MVKSLRRNWWIVVLVIISGWAHGLNMFHYPSYFDDEGTYISQAMAVLRLGKLSPYTYWYDHAPVGWILIAGFMGLTGGPERWGMAINSGRVMMLAVHVLGVVLVAKIAQQLSGKWWAGAVAGLFFGLSPAAITLTRMVLLDNIMLVLLLVSLWLITRPKWRLTEGCLSAAIFGTAILTKETALFLAPAYVVTLWLMDDKRRRNMMVIIWMTIVGLGIAFYPLFAMLKGELMPGGSIHVSLWESLKWQMSRSGGFFLAPDSQFRYTLVNSWLPADALLIGLGVVATAINLGWGVKNRNHLIGAILAGSYIGYLIRGGIVNDQYAIPLLALLPINIGVALGGLGKVGWGLTVVVIVITGWFYGQKLDAYRIDATTAQIEAVEWLKQNLKTGETAAVDAYAIPELLPFDGRDIYKFMGAHHYWKVDQDPRLKTQVFGDAWQNINYVMANNKIRRDLEVSDLPLVKTALKNADLVESFVNKKPEYGRSGYFWGHVLIADEGQTQIYKRQDWDQMALKTGWDFYKQNFIHDYGQIVDPQTGKTTSEGQAYAMLRAVMMNDQKTFDGVWQWTHDHMQYRLDDKLLSWWWQDGQTKDYNSAADADIDAATALILAEKKWGGGQYLASAKQMVADIWRQEVVQIDGVNYLISGAGIKVGDNYLLNPSYFSPYAYRLFAQVDGNPWVQLADDSYSTLKNIGEKYSSQTGLVPNWVLLNSASGNLGSASGVMTDANEYGYDAFRTYFRLAWDSQATGNNQAKEIFKAAGRFFSSQLSGGSIRAVYDMNGMAKANGESVGNITGALAVFKQTDEELAKAVFDKYLAKDRADQMTGYWGDKNNYYDQNWAWFGTALYTNSLPNLGK